jgi:hypothetical protein
MKPNDAPLTGREPEGIFFEPLPVGADLLETLIDCARPFLPEGVTDAELGGVLAEVIEAADRRGECPGAFGVVVVDDVDLAPRWALTAPQLRVLVSAAFNVLNMRRAAAAALVSAAPRGAAH